MKKNLHPEYHDNAVFECACGNKKTVGSVKKNITVEICGACHPFYTGREKLIDTAGRVEKFKARREKAKARPRKTK